MKYDLSVIIPGIRYELWEGIVEQFKRACKKFSYELIFVGPVLLPDTLTNISNIKYVKDLGSPTRCFELGRRIAEGNFLTFLSDDCLIYPNTIDESLDLLLSKNAHRDIICLRYFESVNHVEPNWNENPPKNLLHLYWPFDYYKATSHYDLAILDGVDRSWYIPIIMMVDSIYLNELGGLDCRFEHINMNLHDFAFRAQRNGSKVYFSPNIVFNVDFTPGRTQTDPVIAAYYQNDYPLFKELYKTKEIAEQRPISIKENLEVTENIWRRRR